MAVTDQVQPWFLKAKNPVLFPHHGALHLDQDDFDTFIKAELNHGAVLDKQREEKGETTVMSSSTDFAMIDDVTEASTTAEVNEAMGNLEVKKGAVGKNDSGPFLDALLAKPGENKESVVNMENMMLTENGDVAFVSSLNHLVDLYTEMTDSVTGPRLRNLLEAAWAVDPLTTLRIIFNSRSIHLGKASRATFYLAAGWLAVNHPVTLLGNLKWLSRPVIQKKVNVDSDQKSKKKKEITATDDDVAVLVEHAAASDDNAAVTGDDPTHFDVRFGVAHGYWKDMLNLLVLAVHAKLNGITDPNEVLYVAPEEQGSRKRNRKARNEEKRIEDEKEENKEEKKKKKTTVGQGARELHEAAVKAFQSDPLYRALHLVVARLFAEQLKADLDALSSNKATAKNNLSLCGKWAPSSKLFHDRHTLVASTIAEYLHPRREFDAALGNDTTQESEAARELYLRHAREQYRKDLSRLRLGLDVVERHLTAKDYSGIKYERVPSIAMRQNYRNFDRHDGARLGEYLIKVAAGDAKISGAVLLPSTLVKDVRLTGSRGTTGRIQDIKFKVANGQWNSLVQRIKDSGTLSDSIAVCDVSGSMLSPLGDGTTALDAAIGLSLLVAEVTKPPFGAAFITFSDSPVIQSIDLSDNLQEKVRHIMKSGWNMNTNLTAVFEDLILPRAIEHQVKPEDMVKRIFIFSDMQFDDATRDSRNGNPFSSWDRIREAYAAAGYEVPQMVFWNLAGKSGRGVAKQALAGEDGVVLMSGYSQGSLKAFMDGDDEQEEMKDEADDAVVVAADGTEEQPQEKRKTKPNSVDMMNRALRHKAYSMLKVYD